MSGKLVLERKLNMNLNEVIANYSNKQLGESVGEYKKVHPNDHCNMGQSSNDSFPTAMHISVVLQRLIINY